MKISSRSLIPLLLCAAAACTAKESEKAPAPTPAAPSAVVYTCPAHPDVALKAPGKCPTCKADLVVKK